VPKENGKVINSNEKKIMNVDTSNYNNNYVDSHKGENSHSKNTSEQFNELELNNEHLKPDLNSKIKKELEKINREQQILLKENKNYIIDFITRNKDSIRIEDLKIYEPIYKCYQEKGYCFYCNITTNIICKNCHNNSYHNNKEVWLCSNHWKQHIIEKHKITNYIY
jgi:hypothetical protein